MTFVACGVPMLRIENKSNEILVVLAVCQWLTVNRTDTWQTCPNFSRNIFSNFFLSIDWLISYLIHNNKYNTKTIFQFKHIKSTLSTRIYGSLEQSYCVWKKLSFVIILWIFVLYERSGEFQRRIVGTRFLEFKLKCQYLISPLHHISQNHEILSEIENGNVFWSGKMK